MRVGIESPDGSIYDKNIGIGGFTEGTNISHMVLVWCAFNEVN